MSSDTPDTGQNLDTDLPVRPGGTEVPSTDTAQSQWKAETLVHGAAYLTLARGMLLVGLGVFLTTKPAFPIRYSEFRAEVWEARSLVLLGGVFVVLSAALFSRFGIARRPLLVLDVALWGALILARAQPAIHPLQGVVEVPLRDWLMSESGRGNPHVLQAVVLMAVQSIGIHFLWGRAPSRAFCKGKGWKPLSPVWSSANALQGSPRRWLLPGVLGVVAVLEVAYFGCCLPLALES